MLKSKARFTSVLAAFLSLWSARFASAVSPPEHYAQWKNGPPARADYFPIGVWLQNPQNAERYKAAGINLYIALWRGPTDDQLAMLERAGMSVICSQNELGLAHRSSPAIVGWMHGDEPDNAQSLGDGKGYGPPVAPARIVEKYRQLRAADPTRPILLNLGQGVAWDNYIGRGVRRNHPEDYIEYVKGCDIASFDIYPAVHEEREIAGHLEFVAKGVERLRAWAGAGKVIWNCIECTHISNAAVKATPSQVRAEVWMSLIHGSNGLIYFVHQFAPTFKEAALLDDAEMVTAITAINRQILELAPVLNSPTIIDAIVVDSSAKEVPIATMVKRYEDGFYVFAAAMRNESTRCGFALQDMKGKEAVVEVLGESRSIGVADGNFSDDFAPYGVHLYRVGSKKK